MFHLHHILTSNQRIEGNVVYSICVVVIIGLLVNLPNKILEDLHCYKNKKNSYPYTVNQTQHIPKDLFPFNTAK